MEVLAALPLNLSIFAHQRQARVVVSGFARGGGSRAQERSTTPPRSAMANARIRMTSLVVEVPRIELGSDDIDQGLLRAQPLCRLLGHRIP